VIQHVRAENSRLQEELQVLRTPREQELLGIARERTAAVHRISDVVTLLAQTGSRLDDAVSGRQQHEAEIQRLEAEVHRAHTENANLLRQLPAAAQQRAATSHTHESSSDDEFEDLDDGVQTVEESYRQGWQTYGSAYAAAYEQAQTVLDDKAAGSALLGRGSCCIRRGRSEGRRRRSSGEWR